MAARWAPRAMKLTSAPAFASAAPNPPPTPPAPTTAIRNVSLPVYCGLQASWIRSFGKIGKKPCMRPPAGYSRVQGESGECMFAVLGLGFLLGMQHALEADHIAAVSSIAARRSRVGDIVRHGLTWGLGHTLTLFAFAGAAILLGHAIPERLGARVAAERGLLLVSV